MINSNDYGNYTLGQNKIVLSENLLGGGREASAKLATELRENQKAYADKYNNLVQNQINGIKTAEETQTLNQLAEKAWGKTSWKESEYRQRMEKMYSKYISNDYASSERLLETYINDSINLMINEYSKKLSREAELLLEAKKVELNLIQENFDNEVSFIESQINQIEAVAKSEWKKGTDTLEMEHQEWVSTFQEQLDEKRVNWENNYINFLAEKTEWINRQYVYATNAGIWSFSIPSNYQIGNVGNSGEKTTGIHLHMEIQKWR